MSKYEGVFIIVLNDKEEILFYEEQKSWGIGKLRLPGGDIEKEDKDIFDTAKREKTLLERGLDFADSDKVFDGLHFVARDDRSDYGEERFITVGLLDSRMVVIIWTPRNDARRIISMRYANDREISRYKKHLS